MHYHPRLRLSATIVSLLLVLTACCRLPAAPRPTATRPTPTSALGARLPAATTARPTAKPISPGPQSPSSSELDGGWHGTAITAGGTEVPFIFAVGDSQITSIVWRLPGRDGLGCENWVYRPIRTVPLPPITGGRFEMELGSDLSMSGTFSAGSARGTLTIHATEPANCAGTYEGPWTASNVWASTEVAIGNYQLRFTDACNTRSYKHGLDRRVTALEGYTLLFVYLVVRERSQTSEATPDLHKSSFAVTDANARKYEPMNCSVEGACDPADPERKCSRFGVPFNMLVDFVVPETVIDQPWQLVFKGSKAFTFSVSQGFICPARDSRLF